MNLTISKEQLIAGLQAVQNIVSSRTTLPILSNVLLHAEGNRLRLIATDLDVTISSEVEAQVKEEGKTTVPVKRLFGIVRELGSPEIEMEVDEKNVCSIRSGASFFKINGLSIEEFPQIPVFKQEKSVTIEQAKVKGMLRKTAFAVSNDETRYVLNGIFFSLRDHKLTLVATDGRRLALSDEEIEVPEKSACDFIVPAKAVNELTRLIQEKGEMNITVSENLAEFLLKDEKGSQIVVITKLIEGNYPNYRQVIPAESKERVALVREELLHAMRRAELMTSEKANSVRLAFTSNNLSITANSPDVGEARESIAINYKGKDMAIAFNPRYMIDPLTALPDDEVFLEFTDELSPGVLKINGPFLYVVMPMRLS
jgi:DNA polymerase-3 subunit beta